MPTSQYDRHTLHCALGSVSSDSHYSMFPTSRIICFDSGLRGWIVDVVGDRVDVRVDEGGSRFSEPNLERWRHAIISLQNVVILECWSRCPPRWLHGWTRCPFWITQCHGCVQEQNVLSLCVHLSCYAHQVAQIHREFAQHGGFQTDYQVSLIDLKNRVLRENLFSSISWERDLSPLTTNTSLVLSGFPDRSQIGLEIGWVSWEKVACWTSPRDCRTILPTGCCSTVEPNWSFLLVQSWSCRNEIFGGGRGDMYDFSYKTSPVFHPNNFWNTIKLEVFLEG